MRKANQTLFQLISYTTPYRRKLIIGLICLGLATLAEISGPLLIKNYIDSYLSPHIFHVNTITFYILTYILLQIMSGLFSYQQTILFSQIAQSVVATLRQQTFNKSLRLSTHYLDTHQSGHLISTIGNDTETLMRLYVQVIGQSLQKAVLIISMVIAMFWLSPLLACLSLLMIGICVIIMVCYQRITMEWSRKARQAISQLNHQLSESLQGLPIIQAMVQEHRFAQNFEQHNRLHLNSRLKVLHFNGLLLRPLIDLLYVFTIIGLLSLFAAHPYGLIPVGIIYAFVSYLSRMIEPLNDLTNQISEIQQSLIAGERVFRLLDEPEEISGPHKSQINNAGIEFDNLCFRYRETGPWTLDSIDFKAKKGEMIALVGQTGSGKSTILHLLSGFYPYQSGEIRIDGIPVPHWDKESLRQQIGVIQQDPFLMTGSVADNVRLGRADISDSAIIDALTDVQWFESMPQSPKEALHFQLEEHGRNLSSGQRQLLSFARALVTHPPILVLDEATAHVDSQTERLLQIAIEKRRHNHSWLVVAHRLSTIRDADEILVLKQGQIIERGNHETLLTLNGYYKTMHELQHWAEADPETATA